MNEEAALGHYCECCGSAPHRRPMIFKGLRYCSIECAKALGEMT